MRHIFAVILLALCACAGPIEPAMPLLPAFDSYSCPYLPSDSGYSVQGRVGPDYTICTLTPLRPGLLPAELRVGGHWSLPTDSRFAGFSKTSVGRIAWFYGVRDNAVHERVAFLPTGLGRPPHVQLVVYGGSVHDATLQREPLLAAVVRASMRPNNSFKLKQLRCST